MCRQSLPSSLSPPSAKLIIIDLEEYGYQSRRGIQLPKKWRIEALVSDGNVRSCLSERGGMGGTSEIRRHRRVSNTHRIIVGSWNVAKAFRLSVAEGVSTQVEIISASDAYCMWNTLARITKEVAKETLGLESSFRVRRVTKRIDLEHMKGIKKLREKKKKSAAKVKEMYKKLDSNKGANNFFRIAKARERRRRDLEDIIFIKDEGGRTITNEEEIKKRWREYLYSLFNARESEERDEGVNPSILS
uniref:Uncharacterized protein n=1 Tax=Tanacetum cinerariifolium TaxID=118510 RepID=A0A6L2JYE2_TANCI|nr:hypothetical protein [Tanacetum cinerariifolium]